MTKNTKQKPTVSTFGLLLLVRDARSTGKSERALLNALALRANPEKNYVSWPSYERLERDTLLNQFTLKRAAAALEKKGIISRSVRANRSNRFFINVPLLQEQAAATKAADEAFEASLSGDEPSPFGAPSQVAHREVADDAGDEGGARW